MDEVCIKWVWIESCVNRRFGLIGKKFGGEFFIFDVFYFNERFGLSGVFIKEFVDKDFVNEEFVDNVFSVKESVGKEFINEELLDEVFMVYFDKRFGGSEFLGEKNQFVGMLFVRTHN